VLDVEEHVDDGLEPRDDGAAREQMLGAREACEHTGEIVGGRVVRDAEVVKGGSNGAVEEAVELQRALPIFLAPMIAEAITIASRG
jgi:hypothetical protein